MTRGARACREPRRPTPTPRRWLTRTTCCCRHPCLAQGASDVWTLAFQFFAASGCPVSSSQSDAMGKCAFIYRDWDGYYNSPLVHLTRDTRVHADGVARWQLKVMFTHLDNQGSLITVAESIPLKHWCKVSAPAANRLSIATDCH